MNSAYSTHASSQDFLIIPAYNEEESILSAINTIKVDNYGFFVINDGSKDNTPQICRSNDVPMLNLCTNLVITLLEKRISNVER